MIAPETRAAATSSEIAPPGRVAPGVKYQPTSDAAEYAPIAYRLPCARLRIRITPYTSVSPMATMNSHDA